MNPITLEQLRAKIEQANDGKPSNVYLCWADHGQYIVTTIRLDHKAKLDAGLVLSNVSHDWHTSRSSAFLIDTFSPNPHSYLYDNYWFAFAQMLQLNPAEESIA